MLDPIWIGVIINLCGNVVINISHNAVKYANYMRRKQAEDRRSLNSSVMSNADQFDGAPAIVPVELGPGCCRTGWCSFKYTQFQRWYSSKTRWDALGAIFFVLGNIANFVSLGFAPQSMLAACGSVQFATNVFCELYFKGQAITGRVLKATCVILTGNALIVAFASHESPQLNVDELFRLYFEPAYDVYCVILFAAIVALYVFYEETKKRVREYQRAYDRGMLARIEAGDPSVRIMTAGGANGIALSQHRDHQHLHLVHLPDGPSGQSGGRMDGSSGGHEHALPSGLNGHLHGGASIGSGSGSGSSGEGGHGVVHGHQASGGGAIGSDSVGGGGAAGGHASSGHSGSGGGHHALYGMGALAHGGGGSGLLPVLPPMPTPIPTWRLRMLPFSYASISAIIGTQSVLLAKSMAELLRTTADGRQQFSAYFTWVILAAWLSSMLFWMYRMTTALRKFDKEPLIIPVLQVVWTIFSIVGGGIYFQEFMEMSAVAIALFVIGVLMLLAGVYLLTPESHSDPSETLHLHHGMHLVQSSQLSNHMHLSDVELQNLDGHSQNHTHSPYGLRQAVGMGASAGDLGLGDGIIAASTVNSVSPPGAAGAQMHFRDSHSHSHASHHNAERGAEKGSHSSLSSSRSGSLSKGEHGLRPSGSSNSIGGGGGSGSASALGVGGGSGASDDAVLLTAPPPGKITRVTSTGRIQIQSAPLDPDEHERDHYVVEVSPEFRPFESALSSGAASSSSAGASTAATAASSSASGSTRAVAAHKLHPPPPAFDAAHDDSHDDRDDDEDGRHGKSRTASIDEELRLPASSSSSSLGMRGGPGGAFAASSAQYSAAGASTAAAASAAFSSSAAAAPGPPAQSMGILSEAGLLGSGSSHHHHQGRHHHSASPHRTAQAAAASSRLHTPPLHPAAAFSSSQWGTPVRGPHPSHLDSVGSRPTSASGGHHSGSSGGVLLGDHHHSSSTHNSGSIPPSPALYGYDIYSSLRNDGAVKRGRGMSLGFSMPMIDMDLGEEQK